MLNILSSLKTLKSDSAHLRLDGIDEHSIPFAVAEVASKQTAPCILVASNHQQMVEFAEMLSFIAPYLTVLTFPAWDVQAYDRLPPDAAIQATRMKTLAVLRNPLPHTVVITTVGAMATKVPAAKNINLSRFIKPKQRINREELVQELLLAGYHRVGTVMEAGEFAVRGSLMDIFPASDNAPVRLDFFDDELETLYKFDPSTQRSGHAIAELTLFPACEVILDETLIETFRNRYRSLFPSGMHDVMYKDISEGLVHPQMGHYLPLFYEQPLVTLTDYLPTGSVLFTLPTFDHARAIFDDQITDAFDSRVSLGEENSEEEPYRAIPPDLLYVIGEDWQSVLDKGTWLHASLKEQLGDDGNVQTFTKMVDVGLKSHLPLTTQKTANKTVASILAEMVQKHGKSGDVVVLSAFTQSAIERLRRLLEEHDIHSFIEHKEWSEACVQKGVVNLTISPIPWGFYDKEKQLLLLTEQDIFGEKQNTSARRPRRKAEEVLQHFSELTPGDRVVHSEHGIGRFIDLQTITTGGTAQDFICLAYENGDKLYVPVVALDMLSRYSGEDGGSKLDRLGGAAWQARKAKVKKQLLEMADELIKTAAERSSKTRPAYHKPEGLYDEFVSGFPYVPTSEQQQAIDDVETDLFGSQPMDRLVVGDVGFGKTEVALRAAFVAAADGRQVAVVVPTTLLARQHLIEFKKRFQNFPITVGGLSRLVPTAEAKRVKEGLKKGTVDIVVGTHAILSKNIGFANLGLVVVDEEQRFGVAHKERLKSLRSTVDILTLTATPIPRTLHMSMSGLKELSTITTPPVDRLAIRTFLMGYDSKVIREALLREVYRGGQVYVVTPRVDGLNKLAQQLRDLTPEVKVRTAHGQMDKTTLEGIMADFYDGKFNVLVATTIIESGLDLPSANTIIVHRADCFGLAQLYQLRGRVGRSKTRAYAYLLIPPGGKMTEDAHKRLQILNRLDHIGAGFTLASYDMDLRGPGNLLGAEQSGYIREVGFELYNQMLADAIRQRKSGDVNSSEDTFTPVLNLGLTYRIPEEYVTDLSTRMRLYRRLSTLSGEQEIAEMKDELLDRFGTLPKPVEALFDVVTLRNKCRYLNIDKIETGEKGVLIGFYQDRFANPDGLLHYILAHPGIMSLRADQKVIWHRRWPDGHNRLQAIGRLLDELAGFIKTEEIENGKEAKQEKTG